MKHKTRAMLSLVSLLAYGAGAQCETTSAQTPAPGTQRQILSEGYSLLYNDAGHIGLVDLVLYVKIESDGFEQVIKEISDYGDELKKELDRIARDYPAVKIDLEPLPEMEVRKRAAIGKDKALRFSPLGGRSGTEYERSVLISMANALNHESHLCRVMADEEPETGLKGFLMTCEKRYVALYENVMDLLNREHFRTGAEAAEKH